MGPYGYRYVTGEKRFEPVPDELHWVRQMFRLMVEEAATLGTVARYLDANGVQTQKGKTHWYVTTVRNIVTNAIYKGEWYWNKSDQSRNMRQRRPESEWIRIAIEPIVSAADWDAAQRRLQRNKEQSLRNCKREYLLRSFLFCVHCGHRLLGHDVWGNMVYQCGGRRHNRHLPLAERCPNKGNFRNLDTIVWDEVIGQISNPAIMADTVRQFGEDKNQDTSELDRLTRDEQSLTAKLSKLLDLVLSDDIDRETYRERKAPLDKRLEATRRQIEEMQARATKRISMEADMMVLEQVCSRIQESLPCLTFADKREFLEALDLRIEVDFDSLKISGLLSDSVYLRISPCKQHHRTGDE